MTETWSATSAWMSACGAKRTSKGTGPKADIWPAITTADSVGHKLSISDHTYAKQHL